MPLAIEDRVRETTIVTGTNDATLLGAVTGFQAFSVIGNGNTTYYTISDQSGGNWEVGIGTYSTAGPTLARTTVLSSSAGGSKVSFPAGTKDVFVTYPSEKAVYIDDSGNVQPNLGAASFTSITDSGNLTFTGTGNRILGDFTSTPVGNRTFFQTSTANTTSVVGVIPNGTGVTSRLAVYNNSDPTNATQGDLSVNSTEVSIRSTFVGTGTFLPLTIYTGGSERLRIDTSGNVGIGTTTTTDRVTVVGVGETGGVSDSGNKQAAIRISSTAGGGNDGGQIEFGAGFGSYTQSYFSAIKGLLTNAAGNTLGNLAFYTRNATGDTALTERMRIDSSGLVGIGLTPTASLGSLQIQANAASGLGLLVIGETNNERIQIRSSGSGGGTAVYATFTSRGSQASPSATLSGDALGYYQLGGYDGTAWQRSAWITAIATENYSSTNRGSSLIFSTTPTASTTIAERMRITSAGDVGIGTSAPQGKFQVLNEGSLATDTDSNTGNTMIVGANKNTTNNQGNLFIYSNSTATDGFGGSIGFGGFYTGTSVAAFGRIAGVRTGGSFTGALTFYSRESGGTMPERMRIDSSGNVGIGTSSIPAWSGRALQIASRTSLAAVGTTDVQVTNNGFWTGSQWSYIATAAASNYYQDAGSVPHAWRYAASGTAGNAISWSEAMRITSTGDLLVGTTANFSADKMCLNFTSAQNGLGVRDDSNSSGAYYAVFRNSANGIIGSITRVTTTDAVTYNTTSDYRLKTVIAPVSNAGQRIDALEPIEYDWKTGERARGFLAHKFAEVYPNSVSGEKDAVDTDGNPIYQAMQASTPEVIADLIAEIQSLRKRVAQLESK
jgi:hypothetical protein